MEDYLVYVFISVIFIPFLTRLFWASKEIFEPIKKFGKKLKKSRPKIHLK